jgi:hypothetical protein
MQHLETEAEEMLETMDRVVDGLNSLLAKAQCESKASSGATRQQLNEIIDVHQDTLRSHIHAGELIEKLKRMLEVKH